MNFAKGDKVRWNYNNAVGFVTGREIGVRVQVKFNEGEVRYIEERNLELVSDDECVLSRFDNRVFSGIEDYRRALNRYRLSGNLTDIMYSMSNARTDFLPHQFVPVTKFLESLTDRLLIADEVGLGKTIESMYIWEELRARYNARKLLIVVPAVLRIKWKNDLEHFFNIDATIVHAQGRHNGGTLLERLRHVVTHPGQDSFVYIVSLEGLRTANEVEQLLDENSDVRTLLDMVIIDEAHYMRNSETKSFRLGAKLRDVSEYLLLLSATPIQTSSNNFYNLLRLLSPTEFGSQWLFEAQLADLVPLVQLSNSLEGNAPRDVVVKCLDNVLGNATFGLDADCRHLKLHLDEILEDTTKRVTMVKRLKGKFFYDSYVTRTRKRDVMENRTERRACSVQFTLTPYEKAFYSLVSDYLESRDERENAFSVFRLIARQRQMASCMPAALMAWRRQDSQPDAPFGDVDDVDGEEASLLADILGDVEHDASAEFCMPKFDDVDINTLVSLDSKFNAVLSQIQSILRDNPREKIVIFSFFRGTVAYLHDRLSESGISVEYLIGGMTGEEKNDRINRFRDGAINILVSSEVGSEGIDLQFAKHELNYDLPWNPMRLEQRIGRIDRIGQKSPEIFIYNAFCENTIEDKILSRLYGRIECFRTIIGDLEEILGNVVQALEVDVFRKRELTEEEIEARLRQIDQAVETRRMMSQELEKDAGYLTAYQQHILDNINRARENLRRLTPEETLYATKTFLNSRFPGSSVQLEKDKNCATIILSDAARSSFSAYLHNNISMSPTRLNYDKQGVLCSFDNSVVPKGSVFQEQVDVNHPLMKWILSELNSDIATLSGCELIQIDRASLRNAAEVPSGSYVYYIQNWSGDGVRKVNQLHYFVASLDKGTVIDRDLGERLMIAALLNGRTRDVGALDDDEFARAQEVLGACADTAFFEFDKFCEEQNSLNIDLVAQQKLYVERTTSKKLSSIEDTIRSLVNSNKEEGVIRMWKGKADKIRQAGALRLKKLDDKLNGQITPSDVAAGIIKIMEV